MAVADGHGLPLAIWIASGQQNEVGLVEQTLDQAFLDELPQRLIADRAYDSAPLSEALMRERNIDLIAPELSTRRRKRQDLRKLPRYKRRWKIERLFAWLLSFRRLVTRWEHKAANFLGFLHLGCMRILLRRL